jgi:hypothetical protein
MLVISPLKLTPSSSIVQKRNENSLESSSLYSPPLPLPYLHPTAKLQKQKGLNEVTIENLPPTLQEDYLGVDGKGPALIVDVRCSSQYSKSEDTQGSESAQRLQTLQKQKKQIESQIEMLRSKEAVLKDVLVAFAGSEKFDFSGGIESYDVKKMEARAKREELEEELAEAEKKIREVGLDTRVYSEHQVTGSTSTR